MQVKGVPSPLGAKAQDTGLNELSACNDRQLLAGLRRI